MLFINKTAIVTCYLHIHTILSKVNYKYFRLCFYAELVFHYMILLGKLKCSLRSHFSQSIRNQKRILDITIWPDVISE